MSNQSPQKSKKNYRFTNFEKSGNLTDEKYINKRLQVLSKSMKNSDKKTHEEKSNSFNMFMKTEYIEEASSICKLESKKLKIDTLYSYLERLAKNDDSVDVYDVIGAIKKQGAKYFDTIDTSKMEDSIVATLMKEADNMKTLIGKTNTDRNSRDAVFSMFDTLNTMDKTNEVTNTEFDNKVKIFLENLYLENPTLTPSQQAEDYKYFMHYGAEAVIDMLTGRIPSEKQNGSVMSDKIVFDNRIDRFRDGFLYNKKSQKALAELRKDFMNTPDSYKYNLNMDKFAYTEKVVTKKETINGEEVPVKIKERGNNFSFLSGLASIAETTDFDTEIITSLYKNLKSDLDVNGLIEDFQESKSDKLNNLFTKLIKGIDGSVLLTTNGDLTLQKEATEMLNGTIENLTDKMKIIISLKDQIKVPEKNEIQQNQLDNVSKGQIDNVYKAFNMIMDKIDITEMSKIQEIYNQTIIKKGIDEHDAEINRVNLNF